MPAEDKREELQPVTTEELAQSTYAGGDDRRDRRPYENAAHGLPHRLIYLMDDFFSAMRLILICGAVVLAPAFRAVLPIAESYGAPLPTEAAAVLSDLDGIVVGLLTLLSAFAFVLAAIRLLFSRDLLGNLWIVPAMLSPISFLLYLWVFAPAFVMLFAGPGGLGS